MQTIEVLFATGRHDDCEIVQVSERFEHDAGDVVDDHRRRMRTW